MVVNYADLVNQLRATLGRMEVALGAIADAIVWTGKDGRVQWCNAAFDRLVNQPHILVLGAQLTDLLPLAQAGQSIAPEFYPQVKVLGSEYEVTEYEFQQADCLAQTKVLEISGNYADLGDGNPSAVMVIRDVTQAKRLEAERQQVEREREEYLSLLRATLESTADGIVVVDMELNVPIYNQKYLQIWSMPESLLLPGTSEQRLTFVADQTPDPDAFIARIRELFTDCAEQDVYDLVELKDGRVFERYSQPQWQGDHVIGRVWSLRDITERKRAEEALRLSELKYRNIFENSQVGIWRCQMKDGLILDANQRFVELLGYQSAEEVIGKKFTADFYANREQRQWVVNELRQHGKFKDLELQFRRQDGSLHWGLFSLHLNTEEDCSEGVLTDISDRKQVEEALRQSESRYRALVTASAQSVFTTNADGEVVDTIPLWETLTGQSEAQTKGRGWLECIHPDDREPTMQAWLEAVNTGSLYNVEQRIRIATGEYRLFLVRGVPVRDDRGNIREWVGTQTDITDRKRAEEALRLSELKYRNIFENSQVGIGRTRLDDGLFLDVNQRYAEIMGFSSAAELIGKRFTSEFYANPGDRERILAQLEQYGEVCNFEEQLCRPDGSTAWVLLSLRLNAEENCIDFVIADITDRKRAEEALRRSELKYRNIFENSQFGIGRTRLEDGLFVDANQRFAEILGFSCAKDLMGHSSTEFYANPDERQRILAELQQQGGIRNFELLLRQLDGSLIWTLLSIRLNTEESCLESVITDITDRKRTEEALRRSELKFRNLFENSLVGMFRNRIEDGLILDANQRAAQLFGFSSIEEVIGKKFSTEFYANLDDRWRMLAELHQYGEVNNFEVQVRQPDQATRWVMVSMRLNLEENCVEGVIADITDRQQAEEALRQSEARFRSLYECTSIAVLLQEDGIPIDCNRAAEQLFGYSRQELMSKHPKELSPPFQPNGQESISFANRQIALAYEQGNNRFEWVHRRADGTNFPAEVRLTVFEVGDHKLVQGIVQDLTEQKQAEAALEQRARIDSLLSSISHQFIDQDVDTAINFALQQVGEFTHSDRSYVFRFHTNRTKLKNTHEWCADGIEPFITEPHDCSADYWSCQILLSGGVLDVPDVNHLPPEAAQDQADWKDQSIQSLLIVPMIHLNEVVGCVGLDAVRSRRVWSEQTVRLLQLVGEIIAIGLARHAAEEAMRVAKEAAEVANRAKSTFLANMSHELRTPLNAILGFAQLMERDSALTPRQRESLTIINRSGEHLLNLINDVLEMSRIEAGRITLNSAPFNLHQLLQTIREMFQIRAAAKQLSLQFEIAPDLPQYILTDEGKLRQVLINLLSNAVKFTDTGGVMLRVSWLTPSTSSDSNGQEVQRTTDNGQRTIHFEVEDTGRGIAPEEIDSLFQPFVQTTSGTEAREGTGLGLTISRQFVQLMGGDIHFTSNLGQGSTFCFDVQVTLAHPADVAPTPTYRRVLNVAPNQPTYRILVVDDRQESRDLIAQLLGVVGFETRAAENGKEAIAQWQTWHPHLIWMDMRMPVMDGYEATRQIRALERHRTAPSHEPTVIIALTASAFEEQQASIIAMGCDDFVRKPFREQVIFEKITQYLRVQYIYEEQDAVERMQDDQCNSSSSPILYPSSLQVMPAEWIASLHQAALAVDADRILELIEQIPKTHLTLAEGLSELVRHFCFDEILELTQEDKIDTLRSKDTEI